MEPLFFIDNNPIPPPMTAFLWPIQIVVPDFIMIAEPKGIDFFEDQRKPLSAECILNSSLHD